jgi:protein SCO1/2
MTSRLTGRDATVLASLAFILGVTVLWWALALWPVPGEVPRWLALTRAVCFGSAPNGLPAAPGWMLLIGEPVAMLIALMLIAGEALPSALRSLAASGPGRTVLAGTGLAAAAGLVAAGVRVANASAASAEALDWAVDAYVERLDRSAPPLNLVNQAGKPVALEGFRGRIVLVTFGFGHCVTACPIALREVVRARALLIDAPPVVVVVTVDPWRDTPARFPSIARQWRLGPDDQVVGGSVEDVEAALDRWKVARSRNPLTGEVIHATPVYLIDGDGVLAYRVTAVADTIARLVRGMNGGRTE